MTTSNSYAVELSCADPETSIPVKYKFTVKVAPPTEIHPADLLMRATRLAKKPAAPEELADRLKTQFPGKHTLAGNRYGVAVRVQREGSGL
jgi:hypothetical protein